MRRSALGLIAFVVLLAATPRVWAGCGTDMECKGERICVHGECQDPPASSHGARASGNEGRTTAHKTGDAPGAGAKMCACCCFPNGQRTCLPPGPGVVPGADGAPCHIGKTTGTICCD